MLPFLKNQQEASMGEDEPEKIKRSPDDYDTLDAIADDLLSALASKDAGLVKAALQSFWEHIKDADEKQDKGE